MKTIATASAVAFLVVLTGCDGGSPATKAVQKNEAAPAAGTIKSPNEGLKDRMKSAEGAGAAATATGAAGATAAGAAAYVNDVAATPSSNGICHND